MQFWSSHPDLAPRMYEICARIWKLHFDFGQPSRKLVSRWPCLTLRKSQWRGQPTMYNAGRPPVGELKKVAGRADALAMENSMKLGASPPSLKSPARQTPLLGLSIPLIIDWHKSLFATTKEPRPSSTVPQCRLRGRSRPQQNGCRKMESTHALLSVFGIVSWILVKHPPSQKQTFFTKFILPTGSLSPCDSTTGYLSAASPSPEQHTNWKLYVLLSVKSCSMFQMKWEKKPTSCFRLSTPSPRIHHQVLFPGFVTSYSLEVHWEILVKYPT